MRTTKIAKVLLIFACVSIYIYSAIVAGSGQVYNVSVDLGRPELIIWPFEIAIVGDMGEKGLRIGPKIGRGWAKEAGGEASYKFYVPADGRYYLWAYALWFDVCTNAVFARIDGMERAIIGNDPVYNQWHWVRGFGVDLKRGTHTLVLSNHSDHISLQKVFVTNVRRAVPEDCNLVFSDIFYDGFDGCDQGNFTSWRSVSGDWQVLNPTNTTCVTENVLAGRSNDNAMIILENKSWASYLLNVSVQSRGTNDPEASVGICFGLTDVTQYHQLKWRPITDATSIQMYVIRHDGEHSNILKEFEMPWNQQLWHLFEIALNTDGILIRVDSEQVVDVALGQKITGGIGFQLEGEITAWFDSIHVREAGKI